MYTMDPQRRLVDSQVCVLCSARATAIATKYLNHKVTDATLARMGQECTTDLRELFDPYGAGFIAHGPVHVKFVQNPEDPSSVVAIWPSWLQRLAQPGV